jgi:hypothetical protein
MFTRVKSIGPALLEFTEFLDVMLMSGEDLENLELLTVVVLYRKIECIIL